MEKVIAHNIRKLREGMRKTQAQLAEMCDMDRISIQRLENGKWTTIKTFRKIASALNVPVEELFRTTPPKSIKELSQVIQAQEDEIEELRSSLPNDYDEEIEIFKKAKRLGVSNWDMIVGLAKLAVEEAEEKEISKKELA